MLRFALLSSFALLFLALLNFSLLFIALLCLALLCFALLSFALRCLFFFFFAWPGVPGRGMGEPPTHPGNHGALPETTDPLMKALGLSDSVRKLPNWAREQHAWS